MADILRKGSKGDAVRTLQDNLTKLGYDIAVDGHFGDHTESAVRHLQKSFGYNVDGLVGEKTQFLVTQQIGFGWKSNRVDAPAANAPGASSAKEGTPARDANAGAKGAPGTQGTPSAKGNPGNKSMP